MRVAIVNDSTVIIEGIRKVLLAAGRYDIAWVAMDGSEAVRRCALDPPDVILMDLIMPVMDGVQATQLIMQRNPCPILIVTASIGSNAGRVFEAMGFGALDVTTAPMLDSCQDETEVQAFHDKIDAVLRVQQRHTIPLEVGEKPETPVWPHGRPYIIAIGASSGGPSAILTILKGLPKPCPAAVIIVQHVDKSFAPRFVDWLRVESGQDVVVAKEGEAPVIGRIYVAVTQDHLVLRKDGTLGYRVEPMDACYRPSVDVAFCSISKNWTGPVAGVLLTGMGNDGADGLLYLKEVGATTVAQDEASSAVFGMPRAAIEKGAATAVLPLDGIAAYIIRDLRQAAIRYGG